MDLNIRDVPAEIMRSLRVDAAAEGVTIKELCLRRLVPDGGQSWKPQTVTGQPIEEKIAVTRAAIKPARAIMIDEPIHEVTYERIDDI